MRVNAVLKNFVKIFTMTILVQNRDVFVERVLVVVVVVVVVVAVVVVVVVAVVVVVRTRMR